MGLSQRESAKIHQRNRKVIPGGFVSVNRAVEPEIAFVRGKGCRVWDADGNEYIDYHAAFAPYILGHADPDVTGAVQKVLETGQTLMGAGTTTWEGRVVELIVAHVPSVERAMLTSTGSEATDYAVRVARAHTGRDGIIVMQGGYNGWHNDLAVNVMTPLNVLGPRLAPGEYEVVPLSAGVPAHVFGDVHVVNYNDLDSVREVVDRVSIAAIVLEPILQNIGVVKPEPGYLEGLRAICDETGVVLIFDEVKTGFRHALGGYQSVCGVNPDLSVFGKALANGYPIGAVGGRADLIGYFVHEDPSRRVMIGGTYNAHPIPCAAAIATMEKLAKNGTENFERLYALGERMQKRLEGIFKEFGVDVTIARQGSAFCTYFMDHAPRDWHDLAGNHDFDLDLRYRRALIEEGVYHVPVATKQGSISLAHTEADIDETLERTWVALEKIL